MNGSRRLRDKQEVYSRAEKVVHGIDGKVWDAQRSAQRLRDRFAFHRVPQATVIVVFLAKNVLVMSHGNENHDTHSLKHDTTSKLPSKHSQPPIPAATMGFLDYDTRTRLVKKYRTQFASGPSTVVAVLAGVSPHLSPSA